MPAGRITDYNEDIAARICMALSEGRSLRSICLADDMPTARTVHNWLNSHAEFFQQYTKAREIQADTIFDECLDIADQSEDDIKTVDGTDQTQHEVIARAKLRIDTRKWMAGKLRPKAYGDKVTQELVGKDGGPIETKDASLSEVARRMAFVLASALEEDKDSDAT